MYESTSSSLCALAPISFFKPVRADALKSGLLNPVVLGTDTDALTYCHILDTYRLNAHALEILCKLNIRLGVVDGAERVADCARRVRARQKCLINGNLKIFYIIECVENSNDVNTVFNALRHKLSDNIIRVMLVAEKILTSEKHLELGILKETVKVPVVVHTHSTTGLGFMTLLKPQALRRAYRASSEP